jgi:hypothetical protein
MKRIRIERPSLPVIFLVVLSCIAAGRPVASFVAKVSLKSVFRGSAVSVGQVRFLPLGRVTLSGVSVRHPLYEVTVKEVSASYSLSALVRGIIPRVSIDDAVVNVSLPGSDIRELVRYLPVSGKGRAIVRVGEIEVRRAQIKVNSRTCVGQALITAKVDAQNGILDRLEAAIDSFTFAGASVERASLTLIQGEDTGFLYCRSLSYGKLSLKHLESPVAFNQKTISFARIDGVLAGGKLIGKAEVTLDTPVSYRCSLRVKGLEFGELVKQLKIEEKFTASGPLEGTLVLEGKGMDVSRVDGDFHSTHPGVLQIRDQKIIQNIASAVPSSIPPELFMETLKNYKYNKGTIDTGLTKEGLVSSMVFEAEAGGKIGLEVVLHPATSDK